LKICATARYEWPVAFIEWSQKTKSYPRALIIECCTLRKVGTSSGAKFVALRHMVLIVEMLLMQQIHRAERDTVVDDRNGNCRPKTKACDQGMVKKGPAYGRHITA
jgi:hypothetical protein